MSDTMKCPKCGRKLPADARFCMDCGAEIMEGMGRAKSGRVTAGGVLAIIASCISGVSGFVLMIFNVIYFGMNGGYNQPIAVGLVGFGLGLVAGIQSLRRKMFTFTIVEMVLLMLVGVVTFVTSMSPYGGISYSLILGFPILLLSLLSLAFIATRKAEFT